MYLDIRHTTTYSYARPARDSFNGLWLCPADDYRQTLLAFELQISPKATVRTRRDGFDNLIHHFHLPGDHTELMVDARSSVVTIRCRGTAGSASTRRTAARSPRRTSRSGMAATTTICPRCAGSGAGAAGPRSRSGFAFGRAPHCTRRRRFDRLRTGQPGTPEVTSTARVRLEAAISRLPGSSPTKLLSQSLTLPSSSRSSLGFLPGCGSFTVFSAGSCPWSRFCSKAFLSCATSFESGTLPPPRFI